MRRIVWSCLGAHWRLLVMCAPPHSQSVSGEPGMCVSMRVCVLITQGLNITTLILTLSDVRSDPHSQSSMCGSRLWVFHKNLHIIL